MNSGLILCEVCEEKPAVGRCRICGRYVCKEHLNKEGVCAACVDLMCRVCGTRLSVTSCVVCGRPICRTCSIELEPGIRVCTQCATNSLSLKKLGVLGDRVG